MAAIVEQGVADPGQVRYAIVPVETGRAAGFCSLMRIDPADGLDRGRRHRLRSSAPAQPRRHRGEALLMRHAFDDLGYRRYEWKCDSLNAPSRRAALRLGFIWEGRFRNALVYKGRNRDTDWFSITDGEWPRVRAGARRRGSTTATSTTWAASASAWPPGRAASSRPAGGTEMDQRVSFITLVVTDLDATRRFYVDGLGWEPELHVPGEVLMFKVADKVVLSMWAETRLRRRGRPGAGARRRTPGHAVPQPRHHAGRRHRARAGPGCRAPRRSVRRASASGAATRATSPIPTASAGKWPTTRGEIGQSVLP